MIFKSQSTLAKTSLSVLAIGVCSINLAVPTAMAADNSSTDPITGTQYKATPDMATLLTAFKGLHGKAIETLSVSEARAQPTMADAVKAVLNAQGKSTNPETLVPGVTTRETTFPAGTREIPVRIYKPKGTELFPIVVYFHGGGWVLANKDVYDGGARGLSKAANAIVISVDYRLAPENKFPAAWDDALAAYKYVTMNATMMGGDVQKIALAGESAGGNLAVSTAVSAIAAGLQKPKAVIAIYPVTQTGDMMTPSYVDSGIAKPLNRQMVTWFLDKLLSSPADKMDPRLDIVHAKLAGLPPVTIINAQIDPLRSDGDMLEQALQTAGVPVEHKLYKGVTHEFFGTAAVVSDARDAQEYAGDQLTKAFKRFYVSR